MCLLCSDVTVSTRPTPAGNDVLDPFHPYGITKHLVDKPVSKEGRGLSGFGMLLCVRGVCVGGC